jgi:hypothetical protein
VVIDQKDNHGNNYLCAYFVPAPADPPGKTQEIDTHRLREYLAQSLPEYMVPAYFIPLDHIPLTDNGKVNRKSLPSIETSHLSLHGQENYAAPATDLEEIIADTWKEVLQLERISVHDNFFTIGGNSLNILLVNKKLNLIFEQPMPVMVMFRYTTIHSLARFIEQQGIQAGMQRNQRAEFLEQGKKDRQQRYQKRQQADKRIKSSLKQRLNILEESG